MSTGSRERRPQPETLPQDPAVAAQDRTREGYVGMFVTPGPDVSQSVRARVRTFGPRVQASRQ